MKRFLKIGATCLLMAMLAPTLWSKVSDHDDVFDSAGVLEADARHLKSTYVSPHLEAEIGPEANVVWCGTFQLVWNEACTLLGEDLHFAGQEPEMVAVLNKKSFVRGDLDEESYVAIADFVGNGIHARIRDELTRKFDGQATPKLLPSTAAAWRPQDIVAYSYLFKNLEFKVPFERLKRPLAFGNAEVVSFGVDDTYKPGQAAMLAQVLVLDYQDPDDFVIELSTKSTDDRVILAKTAPKATLGETIAEVGDRIARAEPVPASAGDVLKIPKFNFDITRRYDELLDLRLTVANPSVAKDLQIVAAVQTIRFQMDEKGVKLRSESHLSFGCSAEHVPPRNRVMVFDRPFLFMMQRADAKLPYFAMWISDAELLQRVDKS